MTVLSEPIAAPAAPPASAFQPGPFQFLDFFTERDRERFEGREQTVQVVAAQLVRAGTFVLYGASGTGKTSLILAGLFPELRERGYFPFYVRTLEDPESDLAAALRAGLAEQDVSCDPGATSADLLREAGAHGPAVIAFDQFEEFFIRSREAPEERARFARLVASLLHDRELDVRVLFSLRQDYLAELDEFRAHLPNLFQHEHRLTPLSAFGARRAISSALTAAGIAYDQRFLVEVVDLLEEVRFDPTILQLVCSEVYRRAAARADGAPTRLTAADLEGFDGVEELFRGYLESMVADLEPETRLTAFCVLDALVSRERTKRAVTVDDLLTSRFQASAEQIEALLELLEKHRLVRRQARGTRTWYELVHDRLVPIVMETLDARPEFFSFRGARQRVEEGAAERWDDYPELLLIAEHLEKLVSPHARQLRLSDRELEFVFRSAVYREVKGAILLWAARIDDGRRLAILRELLADHELGCQRGAAVAAEVLGDSRLADVCVEVALDTPDAETREAAAKALAVIGGRTQMGHLREALERSERGRRALDALIGSRMAGARMEELPWWRRLQVWWGARSRTIDRHIGELREARRAGAGRAVRIALWWTLLVLPLGASLILWSRGDQWTGLTGIGLAPLASIVGVTLPFCLGLGWLLGGLFASGRERDRLFQRRRSPFRQTVATKTLLALSTLAAYVVLLGVSGGFVSSWLLALAVASGATALVGLTVQLAAPVVQAAGDPRRSTPWILVAALGVPVVAPFLLALTLLGLPEWAAPLPYVAMVLSALSAMALAALAGDRVEPHCAAPIKDGRRRRFLVGSGVVLSAALWLGVIGCDTLPFRFFADPIDLGAGPPAPVEGSLGPLLPDADYRTLVSGDPKILRISGQLPSRSRLGTASLDLDPEIGRLDVMVPEGRHWLSLAARDRRESYRVGLEVFDLPPIDGNLEVDDRWRFAQARVDLVEDLQWIGSITGVAPTEGRQQVEILVFRETSSRALGGAAGTVRVAPVAVDVILQPADPVHTSFTTSIVTLSYPSDDDIESPYLAGTERAVFAIPVDPVSGRWSATVELALAETPPADSPVQTLLATEAPSVSFPIALRLRTVEDRPSPPPEEPVHPEKLLAQAEAYALSALPDEARRAFEQAARLAEDGTSPLLAHTICLKGCAAGWPQEVISACDRAVTLDPVSAAFVDTRGRCRVRLGDLDGALRDFERFVGSERAAKLPKEAEQRRSWIEELRSGETPDVWDREVLASGSAPIDPPL